MRRLEDVETPIGTFSNTLRLERTLKATVTGSRSKLADTTEETAGEWYVEGVGPVKRTVTNEQESVEEVVLEFGSKQPRSSRGRIRRERLLGGLRRRRGYEFGGRCRAGAAVALKPVA